MMLTVRVGSSALDPAFNDEEVDRGLERAAPGSEQSRWRW